MSSAKISKMIDGSEKRKRQLAFELQNSRVFKKGSIIINTLEHFFCFPFISVTFASKRRALSSASSKKHDWVTVILFQTNMPESQKKISNSSRRPRGSHSGRSCFNTFAAPFIQTQLTHHPGPSRMIPNIINNYSLFLKPLFIEIEKNICFSIYTPSDLNKIRKEIIKKYDLINGSNHATYTYMAFIRECHPGFF